MKQTTKKALSLLLSLTLMMSLLSISSFAVGEDVLMFVLNEDESGYIVTGCNQAATGEIIIPKEYEGLPVTEVSVAAFYNYNNITSVKIPDTVITIGDYAFLNCVNLTTIEIPDSVSTIGNMSFYLTGYYNDTNNWENGILYINNHIVATNSTTSGNLEIKEGTKTIPESAFSGCKNITSIKIPSSLKHIPASAFYNCSQVTSIVISEGVETIGDKAFEGCKKTTSIVIPDSVLTIGERTFFGCLGATEIILGDKITTIDKNAFYGCSGITEIVIPNSVTEINKGAFSYCENLDYVLFGSGLSVINTQVFLGCKLTDLRIPNTITEIKKEAFSQCYIKNLVIGENVKKIEQEAFSYNKLLSKVEFKKSPQEVGEGIFSECTGLNYVIFNTLLIKNLSDYATFGETSNLTPNENSYFVGTGNTFSAVSENGQEYTFTTVVKNDIASDGVCDVLDCAVVALLVNQLREADDIDIMAVDVNEDEVIDVYDYQNIINVALTQ